MRLLPLLLAAALIGMKAIVVSAQSGDRIFYLEGNGKGARDPEIWVMDLDTSNRARLDAFALVEYVGVFTSGMDVSPGGLKVVYSNAADAEFEICMINSDGSNRRQLTNNPGGRDVGPRFTRDGRGILFASFRNGSEDLYLLDIDSGDLAKLTDGFASRYGFSSFSPDGSRIAFDTAVGGVRNIFMMNVDGTELVQLTHEAAEDLFPAWSPDGSRIVFSSRRGNSIGGIEAYDIYIMDSDGSNVTQLTAYENFEAEASWSPNGTKIVYSSNQEGLSAAHDTDIWIMNADGTEQINLTGSLAGSGFLYPI